MTVRDLYAEAIKGKHASLKLLIEFAVYEKGVLKMTDSTEALHRFFSLKHRNYVNSHLAAYEEERNEKSF